MKTFDFAASPRRASALRMVRYGWAAVGPVSIAAAQFALSLQLLHLLPSGAFGAFAFLMITSQFSAGLWSALFCAPLPVLLGEGDVACREATLRCLFATNLCCSILAFAIFAMLGLMLGVALPAAMLFAAYAAMSLLRWYARAFFYTTGSPWKATVSDLTFSVALIVGIVTIARSGAASLELVYAAMAVSVALGLVTFGAGYLVQQFGRASARDIGRYSDIWRRHSGWSLVGVVSIEATANAHAYIVTLIAGPSSFAPIAASALMIRPIAVVMNALTDFERPQIARHVGARQVDAARHAMRLFQVVLVAVWLASALGALVLLRFAPHLIFPERYSFNYLAVGAILWMAIAGVRLLRTPESVLLQGAGAFRWLAYASVVSSGISVVAVVIFLFAGGPMWSVVGVLLGESVFALQIRYRARSWVAAELSLRPTAPDAGRVQPKVDGQRGGG